MIYIDTSTLLKLYVPEQGTVELLHQLSTQTPTLIVSELASTELMSALKRKSRQSPMQSDLFMRAYAQFERDVFTARITLKSLNTSLLSRATQLMTQLNAPIGTLDCIHLATALAHQAQHFYTHDVQLSRAAQEAGLKVWPEFP